MELMEESREHTELSLSLFSTKSRMASSAAPVAMIPSLHGGIKNMALDGY